MGNAMAGLFREHCRENSPFGSLFGNIIRVVLSITNTRALFKYAAHGHTWPQGVNRVLTRPGRFIVYTNYIDIESVKTIGQRKIDKKQLRC
jgi:hypothetical protein